MASVLSSKLEQEYLDFVQFELLTRKEELKRKCRECQRNCNHTPEETMECLANLMTIEYLLDHT